MLLRIQPSLMPVYGQTMLAGFPKSTASGHGKKERERLSDGEKERRRKRENNLPMQILHKCNQLHITLKKVITLLITLKQK